MILVFFSIIPPVVESHTKMASMHTIRGIISQSSSSQDIGSMHSHYVLMISATNPQKITHMYGLFQFEKYVNATA